MQLIDMHCDTMSKIYESENKVSLRENNFHVDLNKLRKASSKAQFFALFVEKDEVIKGGRGLFEYTIAMLDRFYIELEENKDILALSRNYKELKENEDKGKISAFLTIEEGGALEGSINNLRNFYERGIRLITLTWNFVNELGYPNFKEEFMNKGLTERGKEVLYEMNRLGMIIDVSHLSDGGFYDVLNLSSKPFVASHSNARSIKNHPRNLTDPMIRALSEKGGVMGLNFCTPFLGDKKVSLIEDMIIHLKHIKNVGGVEVIAMGTDFDGISGNLEIDNMGHMDKLLYALEKAGFKEDEIENMWYKNVERVIKETLK